MTTPIGPLSGGHFFGDAAADIQALLRDMGSIREILDEMADPSNVGNTDKEKALYMQLNSAMLQYNNDLNKAANEGALGTNKQTFVQFGQDILYIAQKFTTCNQAQANIYLNDLLSEDIMPAIRLLNQLMPHP